MSTRMRTVVASRPSHSPRSVPPSQGLSNSSRPLHPLASQDATTSSLVSTAILGESDWTMERGGEGMVMGVVVVVNRP